MSSEHGPTGWFVLSFMGIPQAGALPAMVAGATVFQCHVCAEETGLKLLPRVREQLLAPDARVDVREVTAEEAASVLAGDIMVRAGFRTPDLVPLSPN